MTQASDISDQTILSAWQQGISETSKDTAFKQALLQKEGELLPCFVDHYQRRKALPRSMRRALQRQWRRSLAGLALLLVLGQAPALAATINVGGQCTLVRAIVAANNDTTASGNCTKGSGADRIVLPRNSTQTLTAINNNNPYYGRTGLPIIRSNITIVGNNNTIRRSSSAPDFRIFAVARTGNLRLQQTTVSGGVASGAFPGDTGGGVFNTGSLTLTNSTISGNRASDDGGGIESHGYYIRGEGDFDLSFLTITNSTISGNRAGDWGGGVNNSAYSGATVTNSTISGNSSQGLQAEGSYITAINSTVTGNHYDGIGGFANSHITLIRTLISGNGETTNGAEVNSDQSSTVTAGNFNLFGNDGNAYVVGFSPGAIDIVPSQPLSEILNAGLANNGGPTQTHALVAGSPAIDTVNDGTCPPPATDQRGITRPRDGNGDGGPACDIGSFELAVGPAPPPAPPGPSAAGIPRPPGQGGPPGSPPPPVLGPPGPPPPPRVAMPPEPPVPSPAESPPPMADQPPATTPEPPPAPTEPASETPAQPEPVSPYY